MELVKNVAAVLGLILTVASVSALVSKHVRKFIVSIFQKYGETGEVKSDISDIKNLLEQHIEEEKVFRDNIVAMNEVTLEFTRTQCRNIIKNIFYHYNDKKILPLYEKKTLMNVEDLYINQLHGNSFASLLLEEMHGWDVDFETTHEAERD